MGGLSAFSSKGGREEKLRCKSAFHYGRSYRFDKTVASLRSRFQSIRYGSRWVHLKWRAISSVEANGGKQLEGALRYAVSDTDSHTGGIGDVGSATATDCGQDYHGSGQRWVSRSSAQLGPCHHSVVADSCSLGLRDGKLSFQEFSDMVQSTDIVKYVKRLLLRETNPLSLLTSQPTGK